MQAIADRLSGDSAPTPRGGRWHLSTVRSILESRRLDQVASDARDRIATEGLLAAGTFEVPAEDA